MTELLRSRDRTSFFFWVSELVRYVHGPSEVLTLMVGQSIWKLDWKDLSRQ